MALAEEEKREHCCCFSGHRPEKQSDSADEDKLKLKQAATEEIKKQLEVQKKRYPRMNEEDIVKFVFQGMLGVGHLISSLSDATERLKAEMDGPVPDGLDEEPLIETISTDWVRLNLRPAKVRRMTAEKIARELFKSAERGSLFTRQNVYDFCVKEYPTEEMKKAAEKILDDDYLPSHSECYRAAYNPSYRVMYRDFKKFRREKAVYDDMNDSDP